MSNILVIPARSRRYRGYPYSTYKGMLNRCHLETDQNYARYGARGIDVYPPWRESFEEFVDDIYEDLGPRPKGMQLDRIDNEIGYWPGNLRWASVQQNCNNRRTNRMVSAFGEEKTLAQWSRDERCKVKYCTLKRRLNVGVPPEEAMAPGNRRLCLLDAFGESKSLAEWSRDERCQVSYGTLIARVRLGWSPEKSLTQEV